MTPEMMQVAKHGRCELNFIKDCVAMGQLLFQIIPIENKKTLRYAGIGHGLRTKINVNIGTSTLYQNLDEEVSKAIVAVKYGGDTIMDLSDGGNLDLHSRKITRSGTITFGTVPYIRLMPMV